MPGDGFEQADVAVLGAQPAQFALDRADLAVEIVDQCQCGPDIAAPGIGKGVHAVLEHAAVLDQMQSPARSLAFLADLEAGQPDRRHQLAPRKLGQHPRIDPIGLARQRRQPADLDRVGDLDLPPATLSLLG
jgi:hypothetical protein